MHLTELGLSPAALACLKAAEITDVEQLTTHTTTELIDSGRFSPTALYEIVCRLNQHGLSLPSTPGGRSRLPSARNREMLRLRLIEGLTLAEIGQRTSVSTERVRQLLRVYFGLRGTRPRFDKR